MLYKHFLLFLRLFFILLVTSLLELMVISLMQSLFFFCLLAFGVTSKLTMREANVKKPFSYFLVGVLLSLAQQLNF